MVILFWVGNAVMNSILEKSLTGAIWRSVRRKGTKIGGNGRVRTRLIKWFGEQDPFRATDRGKRKGQAISSSAGFLSRNR